jgi:hypothetical protein
MAEGNLFILRVRNLTKFLKYRSINLVVQKMLSHPMRHSIGQIPNVR